MDTNTKTEWQGKAAEADRMKACVNREGHEATQRHVIDFLEALVSQVPSIDFSFVAERAHFHGLIGIARELISHTVASEVATMCVINEWEYLRTNGDRQNVDASVVEALLSVVQLDWMHAAASIELFADNLAHAIELHYPAPGWVDTSSEAKAA